MAFELVDKVWDPDTRENADWFGVAPDHVLVLDGAAPLRPGGVSPFANDTVWMVRRFVELFGEQNESLRGRITLERVEEARARLGDEYTSLRQSADWVPSESPFACLTVACAVDGSVELLNMGDQTTLIETVEGSISRFGTSSVRALDGQAILELRAEIASGTSPHAERLAKILPRLSANRELRNVLPGYSVLDVNVGCLGRAELSRHAPANVRSAIIMSDGFYRLVDTFERYTDSSIFQATRDRGLAALLDELRSIEAGDPECVRYPRFKRSDDATALWFRVVDREAISASKRSTAV